MKTNTITNIESALLSFMCNGGFLESSIGNAEHPIDENVTSGRAYTYSELGRLMKELKSWKTANKSIFTK